VLSDTEVQTREYINSNQITLTTAAAITPPSGGAVMTADVGFIGGHRIINDSISDVKIKQITSAGKIANSATSAVSTNTASAIVTRDASGNFAAGAITATSFAGDGASLTALNATQLTAGTVPLARLSGITNTELAANAAIVDTKLATISTAGKVSNSATTATASNTANAIVARDADGKFSVAMVSLTGEVTNATDAATKAYVDSVAQGLDVKGSVRAATTANITLSGEQTVDGVDLVAGNRVLVKNQSTASANGIYVVAAGAWSRATDADASAKVSSGMFVFVEEGTANADAGFVLTTDGAITLGTTALAFAQFSGAGQVTAGAGLTKTGNTLDIVAADATITVNGDSIQVGQIKNANVASDAAIAYSKLNLAGSILNADVASNAAIAYSKLALTGSIVNADISANAAIADSKLDTISTAGKVLNSATTATNLNTASAIVARDASGNFSAGTISATFSGDGASVTNLNASNLASGTVPLARLSGITTTEIAANAGIVDTQLATIATAGKVSNSATTATSANTANAIVARDASGNFSAGTISASFSGNGSLVTDLNASNLASGTVPLARLSGITTTELAANAGIVDTQLATISTAGKVSNSATTATASNTASAIVARDASGNFSAGAITLGADPTQALHAATKQYVDNLSLGLDVKASVRVATTANITLSGTQTIDGVSALAGDRVLVKNQSVASENGIYVVASGAWSRAADADGSDLSGGSFVFVEDGTNHADTGWVVTSNGALTLGTDAVNWTQFSGAGSFVAGNALSRTGNQLDVNVDDVTIEINADALRLKAGGITNSHISATAAIADTKLATISTAGKVSNSATTGTAAKTGDTLVLRDADGRAKFATPSHADDAANKGYVDTEIARFIANETPTGSINGTNDAFSLANTPAAGTVHLVLSGFQLLEGTHFSVSGANITYLSGFQPISGEWHRVSYKKA
jgi:hypothetical protein